MELDRFAEMLVEFEVIVERTLRFNRHAVQRADVLADLWLAWHGLAATDGATLDFADRRNRERLIKAWRQGVEAAGRRERAQRGAALSLDAPVGFGADSRTLVDTLTAHPASDPITGLTELEETLAAACFRALASADVEDTWSQPAGYLHLFEQAGERLRDLAMLCGAGDATLLARLRRLMELHRVQSRLFDGVHRLQPRDVAPPRSRLRRVRRHGDGDATLQVTLWPAAAASG